MANSFKDTSIQAETVVSGSQVPVASHATCRPITYHDVFPKAKWIENERYFSALPDNVQNLLCQVKEQQAFVKLAQEMTEEMDEMQTNEVQQTDQQMRMNKVRERLRNKLAKRKSENIHAE